MGNAAYTYYKIIKSISNHINKYINKYTKETETMYNVSPITNIQEG